MATLGYVAALLGGLPAEQKRLLLPAFQYVLDGWRLGNAPRAQNAQWYRLEATTPATANEEFSIVHGLSQAPSKIVPVLDLTLVGSRLVDLEVARLPDAQRVYLKSPSTGATVQVYVEP